MRYRYLDDTGGGDAWYRVIPRGDDQQVPSAETWSQMLRRVAGCSLQHLTQWIRPIHIQYQKHSMNPHDVQQRTPHHREHRKPPYNVCKRALPGVVIHLYLSPNRTSTSPHPNHRTLNTLLHNPKLPPIVLRKPILLQTREPPFSGQRLFGLDLAPSIGGTNFQMTTMSSAHSTTKNAVAAGSSVPSSCMRTMVRSTGCVYHPVAGALRGGSGAGASSGSGSSMSSSLMRPARTYPPEERE